MYAITVCGTTCFLRWRISECEITRTNTSPVIGQTERQTDGRPAGQTDLFSSGICTANICRASRHCTTQPWRSLTRAVSTARKVLGMRLHSTDTMVCTPSRGGHWGTGFLCRLLKMADDKGMASCGRVWKLAYC